MSEEATNNPSDNNSSSLAGFASLSENDFFEITPEAKEVVKEEKVTTETVTTEPKSVLEEEKKSDLTDTKTETSKTEEDIFKLPGEEGSKPNLETSSDEEMKWVDVAKEIGFELKEDSFDAFQKAKNEFIENIKNESKKEVEVKSFKEQIAELPAETQLLVLGLKNGLTEEEIHKPFKMIADFKALSDADLVAKDFELQKYPQDLIDHKIEELTENGKLELKAKELRLILDKNEEVLLNNKLQEIKQLELESEENFKNKIAKESEIIEKHINTIDTFMEAPISKKTKDYLVEKWKSGAYHELAKDPDRIAKFIIWNEFGEQGIANLKNKSFEKGRDEKKNKLHVIPPVIETGSIVDSQNENARNPVGNWEAFSHLQQ
jgi:hypothetical protein